MATTRIRDFWLQNPDYWITKGNKQPIVDKLIYDTFYGIDYKKEDTLGQVIYLDQLVRHFSRVVPVTEANIQASREEAAAIVEGLSLDSALDKELIWYLMPWKHLGFWDKIFQRIDAWLQGKPLVEFPYLNRFFMDTYRKAYTPARLAERVILSDGPAPYDTNICEYHPDNYCGDSWNALSIHESPLSLLNAVDDMPKIISLSGGVDSMLLAALMTRRCPRMDVVAVHIVYGNRKESLDECNFIKTYCHKLGLPLYIYKVEWLRRDYVERPFYEDMTRDLRFSAYKAVGGGRNVLLGHIQEDVIENIWTNLAHGTHLNNLAKFTNMCVENGVTIHRPWLHISKALIYQSAERLAIPHLKNTTPSWSNRGKFRDAFYSATHAQYGPTVDDKMLEVAERIKRQADLLDKLLFQPILKSWVSHERLLNISSAIAANLDAEGWSRIFTELAHNKLKITKPSYKACCEFERRLRGGFSHGDIVNMKHDLTVKMCVIKGEMWMKVL